MKILALDSSGLVASVALVEDDNLIAEYTIQYKKTHSQTLLPMLEEIRRMVDLDMDTVDGSRAGFFYRAADRFRDGQGTCLCHGETHYSGAYTGGTCLADVWHGCACVSDHGCQEKSGLHGALRVC